VQIYNKEQYKELNKTFEERETEILKEAEDSLFNGIPVRPHHQKFDNRDYNYTKQSYLTEE